ncbi:integrase core domain-containing protein [Actinacidiphila glaucinigra]|uniref:integrase core domain-containing protein n=1 Tax=Actinacidiphila glaucinigra TaxID=235986 RepID=UPI0036BAF2C4
MQGPWRDFDQVERAIFQWVTWYNEERLHSALEYVPPAEYERDFWRSQERTPQSAATRPPDSTNPGQLDAGWSPAAQLAAEEGDDRARGRLGRRGAGGVQPPGAQGGRRRALHNGVRRRSGRRAPRGRTWEQLRSGEGRRSALCSSQPGQSTRRNRRRCSSAEG